MRPRPGAIAHPGRPACGVAIGKPVSRKFVNGRRQRVRRGNVRRVAVRLDRPGRVRVRIRARLAGGKRVVDRRAYDVCSERPA